MYLPTFHKILGVFIEPAALHGFLHPEDDAVLVSVLLPVEGLEVFPHVVFVCWGDLVVEL